MSCKDPMKLFRLPLKALLQLNPGLDCNLLRPGQQVCVLAKKAASSAKGQVQARSAAAAPTTVKVLLCNATYAPQPNDTCASIMARFGLTPALFFFLNPGFYCANLFPSVSIFDPASPTSPTVPFVVPANDVCVGGDALAPNKDHDYGPNCPLGAHHYRVRSGDSCSSIVYSQCGGSLAAFRRLNSGFNCATGSLYVGLQVCVPNSAS
eukprot:jgi/Mesen1/10530/ME000083S10034